MSDVSSFWAPIHKKVEQRHAEEEQLKSDKRAGWLKLVNDKDTSDDVKNWAWGEYSKSLNPETKKKLTEAQPLIQKIFGAITGGQKQQGPKPAPEGPTPMPGPAFDSVASEKRELGLYGQKANIDAEKQIKINASRPQALTNKKPLQYKLSDGTIKSVWQDPKTMQVFNAQGQPDELPEGAEPYKAPTPGTRRAFRYSVDGKEVTVFQDSKTQQMFDIHGKPYELPEGAEAVDQEAKLAKIRGSFYGTGELNSTTKEMMAKYGVDEDTATKMASDWLLEERQRKIENIGAARTTERPMVVGGEVRAVPFTSQNVRRPLAAPGVRGLTSPTPTGTQQGPPAAASPATTPKPAPRGGPQAAPAAGRSVGVPTAQYRAMLNDIRAVRAGAGQLFGDPNVPSIKGLVEYGDLADDPRSRDKLGKALRLTFEGLDQSTGGGHAGVSGAGAALNIGGIGTWVGNILGIPTAVADQQAKMLQDAVKSLTPREREAYNATISSAEGIIGLRRITGASPSLQSVRAIQEAMPVIGVNTTDQAQFNDKSQRLAVEFSAGTRGVPRAGFDAETNKQLDEINGLPERLAKRSGPKTAPVAAGVPTVKTKSEFDALPKGSEYIGKDGKKYRKP